MIKDNKPISVHSPQFRGDTTTYDEGLLTDFDKKTQALILEWVDEYIIPTKSEFKGSTFYYKHCGSYTIKHDMEKYSYRNGGDGYVSNNQGKHAMMLKGYMPRDPNREPNWAYNVKQAREVGGWGWYGPKSAFELLQDRLLPEQRKDLVDKIAQHLGVELDSTNSKTPRYCIHGSGVDLTWHYSFKGTRITVTVSKDNERLVLRIPYYKDKKKAPEILEPIEIRQDI